MAIQTLAVLAGNAWSVTSEEDVTEARQLLRTTIEKSNQASDRIRELTTQLEGVRRDQRIADAQVENIKTFIVESMVRIAEKG